MIPIFIITHGTLADEFVKTAEMIYGKVDNVYSINFTSDMEVEDIEIKINNYLQNLEVKEIIFLSDMIGGSAFNVSMKFFKKYDSLLIAGINLSVFIELLSLRDFSSFDELKKVVEKNKDRYISIFKKDLS